uniref:Uncharacterized protein n=1 Tax=Oryza nivara TaxID=4536 RepID=A0A0E0I7W3_ORYNI
MVLYKQLTTSNGIRLLDTKIKKFMDKILTMQEHRTKVANRRAQRDETTWFARCASLLSLALAMVVAPARSRLKPGDNNEEDLVLTVAPLRSVDASLSPPQKPAVADTGTKPTVGVTPDALPHNYFSQLPSPTTRASLLPPLLGVTASSSPATLARLLASHKTVRLTVPPRRKKSRAPASLSLPSLSHALPLFSHAQEEAGSGEGRERTAARRKRAREKGGSGRRPRWPAPALLLLSSLRQPRLPARAVACPAAGDVPAGAAGAAATMMKSAAGGVSGGGGGSFWAASSWRRAAAGSWLGCA